MLCCLACFSIPFSGKLTSTTVNGLNLETDVARWNSPRTNILTAPKRFQSLSIDRLICEDSCTIQGVDVVDWISGAVMAGLNYTIQGTIYARNPVISYIEALGLVNNGTFNSKHILLKTAPQLVNGIVTIGSRSKNDSITSLTFVNLLVNFINDKNVSEFFETIVKKDGNGNKVGDIFTDIEFMDSLEIESLDVTNRLNGLNVKEISYLDNYANVQQYRMATNELDLIVDKLVNRDRFKHFERMVLRQLFPTEIHTLRKLGYDFDFAALNNSIFQFFTWNFTQNTLQENNSKFDIFI